MNLRVSKKLSKLVAGSCTLNGIKGKKMLNSVKIYAHGYFHWQTTIQPSASLPQCL